MNTTQRTYSAEQWRKANEAWEAGEFSDHTWGWLRQAARENGLLYPPGGGPNDLDTQRATLRQAMNEDPELLRFAVTAPSIYSWSDVIAVYVDERKAARQAAEQAERQYLAAKREHATQREAAASLAGIMQMLADSAGTQPPAPITANTAVQAYLDKLHRRWWDWHNEHHIDSAAGTDGLCLHDACRMMRHIMEAPIDEG